MVRRAQGASDARLGDVASVYGNPGGGRPGEQGGPEASPQVSQLTIDTSLQAHSNLEAQPLDRVGNVHRDLGAGGMRPMGQGVKGRSKTFPQAAQPSLDTSRQTRSNSEAQPQRLESVGNVHRDPVAGKGWPMEQGRRGGYDTFPQAARPSVDVFRQTRSNFEAQPQRLGGVLNVYGDPVAGGGRLMEQEVKGGSEAFPQAARPNVDMSRQPRSNFEPQPQRLGGVGNVYGDRIAGGRWKQELEGGASRLAGVTQPGVHAPPRPKLESAWPPIQRDSSQNNQGPPPEPIPTQHFTDTIKLSWGLIIATVLDTGKKFITFGKNSIKWLSVVCLVLAILFGRDKINLPPATSLCHLPVISSLISDCPQETLVPYFSPDFRKLARLQSRLEKVMEESISSSIVAIDMKRSELAVRDLSTLVEHSSLFSKDSIVKNLDSFVADAKSAGRDLQKFGSRVGGAIDEMVSTNEYVLLLLQQVAKDVQPQISGNLVQRALNGLSPPRRMSPEVLAKRMKEIEEAWYESTGTMKLAVERLIHESVSNINALDRLEAKLNGINKIVVREDKKNAKDEEDWLGKMWTKLGGNKVQLRQFKSHAQLLKDIQKYREDARGHVTRTLFQLEKALSDLEELDKKVSAPALTRGEGVPIEVHIASLKQGTQQLLEGTKRAREREDEHLRKAFGE